MWACESDKNKHYVPPSPFNFKKCEATDKILNSTELVFGDTSPGQIFALAEAKKIPGYCCLDSAEVSGIWGEPVRSFDELLLTFSSKKSF